MTSDQYLAAQLYSGVLSLIQFLNYFRDAIPSGSPVPFHERPWHLSVYCQVDLGILLPNIGRASDFISSAFKNFSKCRKASQTPVYENLLEGGTRLTAINSLYTLNQDLFDLADKGIKLSKSGICEEK